MPKVIFKDHTGQELECVEADLGTSVMHVAIDNGIDGISAECGGACSCATCHCYIEAPWAEKIPEVGDMERELLTCVMEPNEFSRLACQVEITEALDGVVVIVPESQF